MKEFNELADHVRLLECPEWIHLMDMDKDMNVNRQYLKQRGQAWIFRMITPDALIGRTNPRSGKPYGKEIVHGLGTRSLEFPRFRGRSWARGF